MFNYQDFKNKLLKSKNLDNLHNIYEQEREQKRTIIVDSKMEDYESRRLDNYINYCNYKASFINKNKNYCFWIFCKFFRLYKENNINLDYNKIQGDIKFLNNIHNKRLHDYKFNNDDIKTLYNLFNEIKKQDNI